MKGNKGTWGNKSEHEGSKHSEIEDNMDTIEQEIDPLQFAISHINDLIYNGQYLIKILCKGMWENACLASPMIWQQISAQLLFRLIITSNVGDRWPIFFFLYILVNTFSNLM